MQYPVAQKYQVELGEREWRILYDHYVQKLLAVRIAPWLPTRGPAHVHHILWECTTGPAVGQPWSPVMDISPQLRQGIGAGTYESLEQFHRDVCPDSPGLDAFFG